MSYEVSFELTGLQGLKLTIKGNKDEIPSDLGQQLSSMLIPQIALPPAQSSRGQFTPASQNGPVELEPIQADLTRKKSARKRNAATPQVSPQPLDFTPDAAKWGRPVQDWNPTNKSIWLMRVLAQSIVGRNEFSAAELAITFNKFFKDARKILPGNVSRDLAKAANGTAKTENKKVVGTNSTVDPKNWFLTQDGAKLADRLIEQAKAHHGSNGHN